MVNINVSHHLCIIYCQFVLKYFTFVALVWKEQCTSVQSEVQYIVLVITCGVLRKGDMVVVSTRE